MILREFAVDPRLFNSIINCQLLLPLFSASEGRVISKYPKKWKKLAIGEANKSAKDIEYLKIEEILRRLDDTVLFFRGRPACEAGLSWSENVLNEHKRLEFSGIIGIEDGNEEIICFDHLDESTGLLAKKRQMQIRRIAKDMASEINLLFLFGNTFKFIDPHFKPIPRYMKPMVAFLEVIASRDKKSDSGVGVEYHIGTSGCAKEEEILEQNFFNSLKNEVPETINVSLHFHPEEKMHDRWVLSTWAGVQFGQGLDEGEKPPLVNISLLDEDMRQKHWDEYPGY